MFLCRSFFVLFTDSTRVCSPVLLHQNVTGIMCVVLDKEGLQNSVLKIRRGYSDNLGLIFHKNFCCDRGHNICFCWEIRKNIFELSSIPHLIRSCEYHISTIVKVNVYTFFSQLPQFGIGSLIQRTYSQKGSGLEGNNLLLGENIEKGGKSKNRLWVKWHEKNHLFEKS